MDLHELQYIITVAECQSVTKAARKLYISQPSLSYAISQVEKAAGMKLFDRNHQPITLTEAGRLYVKMARNILREQGELASRLADLKTVVQGRFIWEFRLKERVICFPTYFQLSVRNILIPNSSSKKRERKTSWRCFLPIKSILLSALGTMRCL